MRCVQLQTFVAFLLLIMDIQTLLHNLHEEVCCSVCMCKFTVPKQLPCLHSFCLHCLNRIQRTSGNRNTVKCPECRQDFPVPGDGNLAALPTNFRINSLLDVLAINECSTSGVKCGNCEKRSEQSSYCFQCCSFWCDDCIGLHNRIKAYKEHYAPALKDFQDQDFENILKRPAFCQQKHHEKEELKFFCADCEVAICNSCVATVHDDHAKVVLDAAANERKLKLNSAIEHQKQQAQEKISKIAKMDESCFKIQELAASVKRNVQEFADSIFAAIEAKKMEIFEDVENQVKESLERLGKHRKEMEEQVKMHELVIEKSETLLRRSTSAQIMQPNEFLDKIFQEEVDQECTAERDNERFPTFVFVKNQELFDRVRIEQIGSCFVTTTTSPHQSSAEGKGIIEATVGLEAQIVVSTMNIRGEQCYEERDCVTVEIRNRQGHDCATQAQVQNNKDGTYKISYFAKETGRCQASVKVNGEHVRGSPFKVQFKPRQFRPVLTFGQQGSSVGMFCGPCGVAVNERNEIAVSDVFNHRIQVFSSNGNLVRSFGRKGDNKGEFNCPTGIAFHNDNIIVADCSNHRVQLFSSLGEYLGQFGGEGSLDNQLYHPYGLSLDSDGNIIIADTGNKLIKIFSHSGGFLHKIGTKGSFTDPFHCIQHEHCIIVSDRFEHCVKVFDREGKFLYKFGKQGEGDGDGEFNGPRYLSVTKSDHVIVCDANNHRVQVFELSGKFLTKFGRSGSGNGEFNLPASTAVLNDGRIVVSDLCNHRIQIFE